MTAAQLIHFAIVISLGILAFLTFLVAGTILGLMIVEDIGCDYCITTPVGRRQRTSASPPRQAPFASETKGQYSRKNSPAARPWRIASTSIIAPSHLALRGGMAARHSHRSRQRGCAGWSPRRETATRMAAFPGRRAVRCLDSAAQAGFPDRYGALPELQRRHICAGGRFAATNSGGGCR